VCVCLYVLAFFYVFVCALIYTRTLTSSLSPPLPTSNLLRAQRGLGLFHRLVLLHHHHVYSGLRRRGAQQGVQSLFRYFLYVDLGTDCDFINWKLSRSVPRDPQRSKASGSYVPQTRFRLYPKTRRWREGRD